MSYIEFGEGSSQLMTNITNISPMDTTQENFSENASVSALTLAQKRKNYNRNYYQRTKEKNKSVANSQEFGEGSRQPMTNITNISPMETTKGKINETTHFSALTLAQRRKIVNRNYYQRSKEKNKSVANTQGTSIVDSEGTNHICSGLTHDNFNGKKYDIIIICILELT